MSLQDYNFGGAALVLFSIPFTGPYQASLTQLVKSSPDVDVFFRATSVQRMKRKKVPSSTAFFYVVEG